MWMDGWMDENADQDLAGTLRALPPGTTTRHRLHPAKDIYGTAGAPPCNFLQSMAQLPCTVHAATSLHSSRPCPVPSQDGAKVHVLVARRALPLLLPRRPLLLM